MEEQPAPRRFPAIFDEQVELSPQGCRWLVGRDVLGGLVAGIDEFIEGREQRWRCPRDGSPVILAAAPWFNDPDLIDAVGRLGGAAIVASKKMVGRAPDLALLKGLAARTSGLPLTAFPDLAELAPREEGEPRIVGPYDGWAGTMLESVRVLGFRPRKGGDWPPLAHTKVALLGHLIWTDDLAGLPDLGEHVFFRAKRVWRGSTNFTVGARVGLEEGGWSEDPPLLALFERYLLRLLAWSEPLDGADELVPELASVVYDDDAFAELMAESAAWQEPDEADTW